MICGIVSVEVLFSYIVPEIPFSYLHCRRLFSIFWFSWNRFSKNSLKEICFQPFSKHGIAGRCNSILRLTCISENNFMIDGWRSLLSLADILWEPGIIKLDYFNILLNVICINIFTSQIRRSNNLHKELCAMIPLDLMQYRNKNKKLIRSTICACIMTSFPPILPMQWEKFYWRLYPSAWCSWKMRQRYIFHFYIILISILKNNQIFIFSFLGQYI